ncbi:hypothetical protein [Ottowia testudinis]|uniref:Uncharacterized protein n=1 Tax=Ottowia testudinis TaxID=2816950 RepID=A0A975CFH9_9BURK|nr:hypothetical protein [Ottowia testudinis]QTD45488.1 hypothetical protein J1M35_00735 [Ottowia testudinis]
MNDHDPVFAPTPGVPYPAAGDPAMPLLHFAGATNAGAVGLVIARGADAAGAVTGAEQVLRLALAEPLIRAVEQWLQSAWDPAPVAALEAGALYEAVVRDPALAPPGTRLWVPLGALLARPPEALRAPALAWGSRTAQLVLGTVPAAAAAPLQPGSLLWLPASFGGSGWAVRLIDPARRLPPCPAQFDLPAQRLSVPAAGAGALGVGGAERADEPRVLLQRPVQVPLDHWLGWGPPDAPFHWPVPQPWSAELRLGQAVLAHGGLLPVGAGCGLLVESVARAEVCGT